MLEIEARGYANPDVLVSTDWVAQHLNDTSIRLIESNEDQLLYRSGHIEHAVEIDWVRDLNDSIRRDYLDQRQFEELMTRCGISRDTTVVLYGDKNNWWACYAFWVFTLFGHPRLHIMDGGRLKWMQEGRPLTKAVPSFSPTVYQAPARDDRTERAFRDEVLQHINRQGALLDVRSPEEFSGQRLHMDGYPNEGALRGGHIPGARNVPWAKAVDADNGCFRTAEELRRIYQSDAKLDADADIIAYCRIGERSSHSWFVLKYLLGYPRVRNYDGSWTEWGNLVGVPIERGSN